MKIASRRTLAVAAFAAFGALSYTAPAAAQSDAHQHAQGAEAGKGSQGMGMDGHGMEGLMGRREMGGMMEAMQGCPMMQGGLQGGHAMPQLPPGNEKLELQMHADMMKAMGDILAKYAARLPDRK